MPYTLPQLIIQVSYGIFLFPLYVFVMIQFLTPSKRSKLYNSYFFILSTALGFVDIIQYVVVWIFIKLPACPLTYRFYMAKEAGYIFNILSFLYFYSILVRRYLIFSSAANRLTCLTMPFRHEGIWKKYGKYFLLISFVLPILLVGDYLFGNIILFLTDEAIAYVMRSKWIPAHIQTIIVTSEILLTAFLTFFLNLGTIISLIKSKDIINLSQNSKSAMAKEKKLLIITIWDFLVDVALTTVRTITVIRTIIGRRSNDDTPFILAIWIMDIGNLFRPIFLILMCDPLREAFLKFLFIKIKFNGVSNSQVNVF